MATSKRKSKETSATRPLVIVESPNKVKTISKILGEDYVVRASVGHFADIPATKKGVEIENDFALSYALTKKGVDIIDGLRKDLANASEVILATDADREGEMIAYLLDFFLKPNVPVSRIEFRNITKNEVLAALDNRRQINMELVEAARARRALDHLVGFQVSPVLWSKVRQNLSAGRVQSPALRLTFRNDG
ncbi:MAG: topoisomerase [Actinomycetota bacterium]